MTIVGQDFLSTGWQNSNPDLTHPRYGGVFSALTPTGGDGLYFGTSSLQYLNNHESMKKYIDLYSGSGFAAIDSNGTIATSICGIFADSSLSGFTRVRSSPNQSYHGYFIAYTDRICLYVGGCIYGYGVNGLELTNTVRFGGYDNTILEPNQNGIIFSSTHNIITGEVQ